jgi:hypothetical protein
MRKAFKSPAQALELLSSFTIKCFHSKFTWSTMRATLQSLFFRSEVASQLVDVCESPSKCSVLFIKETALTAIADRATLQVIIQILVDRTIQ